jgi:hypothetical protein
LKFLQTYSSGKSLRVTKWTKCRVSKRQ